MGKSASSYHHPPTMSRFVSKATIGFFALAIAGTLLSCENSAKVESEFKQNSPPVIVSVNIFPEHPAVESELNAFAQSHNPDGDPVIYHIL